MIPEADDATDETQRDQSWNAVQLGASGRNEAGDWQGNKIGPRERAKRGIGDVRLRSAEPCAATAANGTRDEAWIFLRVGVSAILSHGIADRSLNVWHSNSIGDLSVTAQSP
jgi:hypothetical protein